MKRILVVEDEASIRELVALNLKMTGWEVLEAPSAERALELIQKNPPFAAFPSSRLIRSPSRSRCRS